MSYTALEIISRGMMKAGFSRVSQEQVSTENSNANKGYYALLEAICDLTAYTPTAAWNDDEVTGATVASQEYLDVDADTNPNLIFYVAIDSSINLLTMTTRQELIADILPVNSNPTTTGKPTRWYVHKNLVKFWRIPDQAYTITYGFQQLPQTFSATAATSTILRITDEWANVLIGMTAIRILDQFPSGAANKKADLFKRIEDMTNPTSLLTCAIRNNKLEEKKTRQKFRYPRHFRKSRFV